MQFQISSALLILTGFLSGCARPNHFARSALTKAPPPAANWPATSTQQPVEFPGLQNVVAYSPELLSGSAPGGEAGFASLERLGIHTIISVDGARPDLELARAHGLRYVHLPIGYNGMDPGRTLEIARAVHDLDGPVYIHCHHGKHRSAAAAAAVAVTLGTLTSNAALARMQVSGTAPDYPGLFECVRVARRASSAELSTASAEFPELIPPAGLVATMLAVDETLDRLQLIENAGWQTPRNHPDLVPPAEASRLADLFRTLAQDPRCAQKPPEFMGNLQITAEDASALEECLLHPTGNSPTPSNRLAVLARDCRTCHSQFRN